MQSTLLLILALFIGMYSPTIFRANGTLNCNLQRLWCFHISFYESDPLFKDDRLDFVGIKCTRNENFHYALKGEEDGDGVLNNSYEIDLYLRHNCTTSWTIRQIKRKTQYEWTNTTEISIQWNVTLADRGNVVDAYVQK